MASSIAVVSVDAADAAVAFGGASTTAVSTGVALRPVRRCTSRTGVMAISVGATRPPMASMAVSVGPTVISAGKIVSASDTMEMPTSKLLTMLGAMKLQVRPQDC